MSKDTPPSNLLEDVDRYYSDKLLAHGPTPQGVDWNGTESQVLRFQQLTRLFPDEAFTVGDLGCGYGSFFDYLCAHHARFDYLGIDISAAMIKQGRELHDGANCRFIQSDRPDISIDYIVASGTFNVRQQVGDAAWLNYIYECLAIMHKYSNRGFAFNCLTSYSDLDRQRSHLYYADPKILFDHCMRYSRHVALLHDYGLYEFTILVRK